MNLIRTNLSRTCSVLATLALALTAGLASQAPAVAHDGTHEPTQADLHSRNGAGLALARLRQDLAPYKDVSRALADGFVPVSECTESPEGGMGVHFLHPARAMAPVDPAKPAILLYSPTPTGYELMGAEWFAVDADQDLSTHDDRPSLWGRPFDGPMPGHDAAMPVHYDLHVWLYDNNPAGIFAPWNPSTGC